MVDTSLVGVVMNGLSHFYQVRSRTHFSVCLIRGLGGNLIESAREAFAKEVLFPHFFFCFLVVVLPRTQGFKIFMGKQ